MSKWKLADQIKIWILVESWYISASNGIEITHPQEKSCGAESCEPTTNRLRLQASGVAASQAGVADE
jgi:hypothetical protein